MITHQSSQDRQSVYWWRVPDDEDALQSLRPAELKCYLVVTRAIQRDRNAGKLSIRQIAERAKIGKRHAEAAMSSLVSRGLLGCNTRLGATTLYSMPCSWRGDNRPPTGGRLEHGTPLQGGQHLEFSEYSESSSRLRTVERGASPVRTMATTTSSPEVPKADMEAWWTAAELEEARRAIAQHRGRGALPDERVTAQVLVALQSALEFRLWLVDLAHRFPGNRVKGWGFYAVDARDNWPTRRTEVQAAHRAAIERTAGQQREADAERHRIEHNTPHDSPAHLDTAPRAKAKAKPSSPPERGHEAELSIEDRRLLAEARKTYRFASRESLLEALPELRAAKLRTVEESAAAVNPRGPTGQTRGARLALVGV